MLAFPSLYGMAESIRMVLELGPATIEARVLSLANQTAQILEARGAAIQYANTNIVAAHWADRDASQLARTLRTKGIIVAARHGNLRVSPHFYNTEEDLDVLRRSLA